MTTWLLNPKNGLLFPATPRLLNRGDLEKYHPTRAEVIAGRRLTESAPTPDPESMGIVVTPTAPPEPIAPVIEEPPAAEVVTPAQPEIQREDVLTKAILGIDPQYYGKPFGNRPAMPKVATVESLTGLTDVGVDEILAIMHKHGLVKPQ